MKLLLILSMLFLSTMAQAEDKIVCKLSEINNPANVAVGEIDLNNLSEDGLYSFGGIDVGDENYSFDLSIDQRDGAYVLNVYFYENKSVQDEVANYGWELSEKGSSVIVEPLEDSSGATIMNFVCDYI